MCACVKTSAIRELKQSIFSFLCAKLNWQYSVSFRAQICYRIVSYRTFSETVAEFTVAVFTFYRSEVMRTTYKQYVSVCIQLQRKKLQFPSYVRCYYPLHGRTSEIKRIVEALSDKFMIDNVELRD